MVGFGKLLVDGEKGKKQLNIPLTRYVGVSISGNGVRLESWNFTDDNIHVAGNSFSVLQLVPYASGSLLVQRHSRLYRTSQVPFSRLTVLLSLSHKLVPSHYNVL